MTDGTVNPHARLGAAMDPAWEYVNSNPPLPSSLWHNVHYTVIEDKPILSASAGIPIIERSPVGASASAVWSINLFEDMKYEQKDFLPRQEYEINGAKYSFTPAGFENRQYPARTQVRTKEDITDWNGEGSFWKWVEEDIEDVDLNENKSIDVDNDDYEETILEIETGLLNIIDEAGNQVKIIDGELHKIQLYHEYKKIDQDAHPPKTVTVKEPHEITLTEQEIKEGLDKYIRITRTEGDKYAFALDEETQTIDYGKIKITHWENLVKLMDSQDLGEIDTTPGINDEGIEETGGLQPGYDKETLVGKSAFGYDTTFKRRETAKKIITTEKRRAKEIFTRRFKVRDGYKDKNNKSAIGGIYEVRSDDIDEDKFSTKEMRIWKTDFK
jgi:hypothetical protein